MTAEVSDEVAGHLKQQGECITSETYPFYTPPDHKLLGYRFITSNPIARGVLLGQSIDMVSSTQKNYHLSEVQLRRVFSSHLSSFFFPAWRGFSTGGVNWLQSSYFNSFLSSSFKSMESNYTRPCNSALCFIYPLIAQLIITHVSSSGIIPSYIVPKLFGFQNISILDNLKLKLLILLTSSCHFNYIQILEYCYFNHSSSFKCNIKTKMKQFLKIYLGSWIDF